MLLLQTISHCFRDSGWARLQFHVMTIAKIKERGEKEGEQTILYHLPTLRFFLLLTFHWPKQTAWHLTASAYGERQSYEMPRNQGVNNIWRTALIIKIMDKYMPSTAVVTAGIHAIDTEVQFFNLRIYTIKTICQSLSFLISYFLLPKDYCKIII